LFSSTRNKFGYASRDGTAFYFIEWEGDAAAGAKTNASIRNSSGGANLQTLQIIQSEDNRVWIVYKENADSEEGRVVQKW
ncbi:MAG: hypothetical protein LBL04_09540, partial [Bacteroidales bacterium]|nr:hypothetical protein [Bacteroidales bacterium]